MAPLQILSLAVHSTCFVFIAFLGSVNCGYDTFDYFFLKAGEIF